MAYQLIEDREYPGWGPYTGWVDILTANITGPPEQLAPVEWVDNIIAIFAEKITLHGATTLRILIWADWSPTLYTKYRVTCWAHGSPAIPWALILYAIMIAIAALALVLTTWMITSTFKKAIPAEGLPGWVWVAGAGALGLGVGYFVVRRKGGEK